MSQIIQNCTFNLAGGEIDNIFNRTDGSNIFNNCTFNFQVAPPPPIRSRRKFVDIGKRVKEAIRKRCVKVFSYVF
jgi:hypothetical protein